jgi:hypothetical protein
MDRFTNRYPLLMFSCLRSIQDGGTGPPRPIVTAARIAHTCTGKSRRPPHGCRTRTPPSGRWTTASQRRSRLRGTGGTGAIARDPIRQPSKSQMRAAFRSTNARFYSACTAPSSALVTSRCSWPCRCFCHRQRARASSSSASRRSRSRPRRSCPASACQRPSPRSGSPGPAPSADSSG